MALTCNPYPDNTIGTTQQTVACLGPKVVNLIDDEIPMEEFLLLVIDTMNRMAVDAGVPPTALGDIEPCDVAEVLRRASCVTQFNTPVFSVNIPQLQGIILAMMNNALCGG